MRALILLVLLAIGVTARAVEPAAVTVTPLQGHAIEISPSLLSGIAAQEVTATAHEKNARYTGYDLRAVLQAAGVTTESLGGKQLGTYVLVTATDGYQAVFSVAELDRTLGNTLVLLVNRENGQPLPAADGPWRLVVPSDGRPARWVRQVVSIRIVDASNPH